MHRIQRSTDQIGPIFLHGESNKTNLGLCFVIMSEERGKQNGLVKIKKCKTWLKKSENTRETLSIQFS